MNERDDGRPQPAPNDRPDWQDKLGPPPGGLPYVPDNDPAAQPPTSPPAASSTPAQSDPEPHGSPPPSDELGPREPPWRRERIPRRPQPTEQASPPEQRVERPQPPVTSVGKADSTPPAPPWERTDTPPPHPQAPPTPDPAQLAVPYTQAHQTGPGGGSGGVQEHRTVVEHSTPLWRLVGVIAAFGALGAIGYYPNIVGRIDDAATILVITAVYTVTFWARRQPAKLEARLGPFGRIGRAITESQADITRWVNERTLLAGVLLAVIYGVLVVIGKHIIAAVLSTLYSPWLAVALGLAVGAAVVAPELWRGWGRRISGQR